LEAKYASISELLEITRIFRGIPGKSLKKKSIEEKMVRTFKTNSV